MYHIYFMCNSHTDPESHDFYFFCRSESIFFFFFGIGIYSRPVVIRFRMCTHNTHRHTYWKGIYTVGGPESYVHTSLTGARKGKVHIRWVDLNHMYTHVLCWICENLCTHSESYHMHTHHSQWIWIICTHITHRSNTTQHAHPRQHSQTQVLGRCTMCWHISYLHAKPTHTKCIKVYVSVTQHSGSLHTSIVGNPPHRESFLFGSNEEPGGRGPPLEKNPTFGGKLGLFFRGGPLPPGSAVGNHP